MLAVAINERSFRNSKDAEWREALDLNGFTVLPHCLSSDEVARFLMELRPSPVRSGRAGIRHALQDPNIARLAWEPRLWQCARDVLGSNAVPFSATVFDKSPAANWLVAWHQDRAVPLRERREMPGWSGWSVKEGVTYANAPAEVLSNILALRVHLDDSTDQNGPLRVLAGTHKLGVLSENEIGKLAAEYPAVHCIVPRGGVLAIRPLLVHASSKLQVAIPRRIIHIEYTALGDFSPLRKIAAC
jgi:ectoine hydroxylase-related dioxygenase (phytanoyl-CoA dioxygenase family)